MNPKDYIKLLAATGRRLDAMREEELRQVPYSSQAIEAFNDAFEFAISSQPPTASSGLVEYHRILSRQGRR